MSADETGRLRYVEASGAPYDIGVTLGRFGADATHRHLLTTHAWASVMAFRGDPRVATMRRMTEARFPAYWRELEGLAHGLGLPLDDVFLWNCRGDVWALAPDGCTTVQVPGDTPVVAHNEDGDPCLHGHCAIARVQPADGAAFAAFVYPASIPGHTFAATGNGLVQTVNNIRSRGVGSGLPRMLLGRAVLDCATLDEALQLLERSERAGAYHFTLAQRGDRRLLSVEFTHGNCSVLTLEHPRCHANHLIHQSMAGECQVITGSSQSRQRRSDEIVTERADSGPDPLAVLWDKNVAALPIYREQSDDPDQENTLATAVFYVGARSVEWQVYDRAGTGPRYLLRDASRVR